jgi:argininosuccinate synthase
VADVGQEEDFEAAREKALAIGALKCEIIDIRREFIEELCFPAIACNAVYENVYLLGTSLARPVIARAQIDVAKVCQLALFDGHRTAAYLRIL